MPFWGYKEKIKQFNLFIDYLTLQLLSSLWFCLRTRVSRKLSLESVNSPLNLWLWGCETPVEWLLLRGLHLGVQIVPTREGFHQGFEEFGGLSIADLSNHHGSHYKSDFKFFYCCYSTYATVHVNSENATISVNSENAFLLGDFSDLALASHLLSIFSSATVW